MRTFAIGDIHGCSAALRRLDEELNFKSTDTVITLGDYVDRGPDSKGVIDFLIALQTRCRLIPLRGNHEVMMLNGRSDWSSVFSWLDCGGDTTLDSYNAKSLDDIPAAHWEFLESTLPYHEGEKDFFVHANAQPDLSLAEQPDYIRYWEFLDKATLHMSGKRMICGHTSQKSGQPLNLGTAVCIDTYAHGGGWLTCLETTTDLYWQASQQGKLRQDGLG